MNIALEYLEAIAKILGEVSSIGLARADAAADFQHLFWYCLVDLA